MKFVEVVGAAAQNAQPSGFRYEGKIFRSTEARKDLLETITEIKTVLEKNKSQFQIPIEFNDEKFKKDFMASGDMSAKVYLEYEKARKEYLNLQLEATKETAKEEDLRRLLGAQGSTRSLTTPSKFFNLFSALSAFCVISGMFSSPIISIFQILWAGHHLCQKFGQQPLTEFWVE